MIEISQIQKMIIEEFQQKIKLKTLDLKVFQSKLFMMMLCLNFQIIMRILVLIKSTAINKFKILTMFIYIFIKKIIVKL